MPELPDIVVYLEALEQRVLGHVLERVRIAGPFLLRTAVPPIDSVQGHKVTELRRIGKRIAVGFENGMWLVFHLMIAGRLIRAVWKCLLLRARRLLRCSRLKITR